MVSLVDIAKKGSSQATVPIRGEDMQVNGLTAEQIADIFMEFPEIRRMVTGNVPDPAALQSLLSRFPEAAGLILAAGTGVNLENKEEREAAVAAARSLSLGEQFDLFDKILECTFPRGVQNFLDGVQKHIGGGGRGWAPGTTSPAPSNAASPTGGSSETAGSQPQSS